MKKRQIVLILSLVLVIAMIPAQAFGKVKSVETPREEIRLISSTSKKMEHNFVEIIANGSTLQIQCETPIEAKEFNISVRRVEPQSEKSQWICRAYPIDCEGYFQLSATVPNNSREGRLNGTYVLLITMLQDGSSESKVFYKNCNFKVSNGQFSIIEYDEILAENQKFINKTIKADPKKFTSTTLSDIKNLVYKDPKTKKVAAASSKKAKYFKSVSDKVTQGATGDYEKLLKIYEYIGENFYYDDIAYKTKKNQYVDPYRNLYNLRNGKKSANSQGGKVATTCVGYGAAFAALARAQGIPTMICNGHHVGMTKDRYNNWTTEEGITTVDHWWVQCYVDERWVIIDPTPASSNKWDSQKKAWTTTGLTNYIYFDPTPQQFATSHVFFELRGIK